MPHGITFTSSRPSGNLSDGGLSRSSREAAQNTMWLAPEERISILECTPGATIDASVALPITPWTFRKGYIHGADMFPAIEYLVREVSGVRSSEIGLKKVEFFQPAVGQLNISVRPLRSSTNLPVDSLLTAFKAVISVGHHEVSENLWLAIGSFNGKPITESESRNPLIRRIFESRSDHLISPVSSQESVRFVLNPLTRPDEQQLADLPGMRSATVLDMLSLALLKMRGSFLPETEGILIKKVECHSDINQRRWIEECRSLVLNVTSPVTGDSRSFRNFQIDATIRDGSEHPLITLTAEVATARTDADLDRFIGRTRARVANALSMITNEAIRDAKDSSIILSDYSSPRIDGGKVDEAGNHFAGVLNLSAKFFEHPYNDYAQLRSSASPAVWLDRSNYGVSPRWFVTRYDVASSILRDGQRFGRGYRQNSGETQMSNTEWVPEGFADLRRKFMLFLDKPFHAEIRQIFNPFFTREHCRQLDGSIRARSSMLLDQAMKKGEFDLVTDYAEPYALGTIAMLLGVPYESVLDIKDLCVAITNANGLTVQRGSFEKAQFSAPQLAQLWQPMAAAAADDGLLNYIHTSFQSNHFGVEPSFLIANSLFMLIAGYQTTVNLITNTAAALIAFPDQWRQVKFDAHSVSRLVEEGARFDAPVQVVVRTALTDVELSNDVRVSKGEKVTVVLGSANRDPSVFQNADTFNIDRPNNKIHLSYGAGIHSCIGINLAALEAQTAFLGIFERGYLESGALSAPVRRADATLRGFENFPVKFST